MEVGEILSRPKLWKSLIQDGKVLVDRYVKCLEARLPYRH